MGRLIVLDGVDASGKTTQVNLLCDRLSREGKRFLRLKLPNYEDESSALVRMYLGGQFGSSPDDVNAYAASSFYAVDRYASYKKNWGGFYEQGGIVVTDRYVSSNAIHQSAKLDAGQRDRFLDWLQTYEYELLGLPRPDVTFFMDMPVEHALRLLNGRRADKGKMDIHEADAAYLERCYEAASYAADRLGWVRIRCVKDGLIRSREDIAEEIYGIVQKAVFARGN